MSKQILYVFAGANGSGKTTVAKKFTKNIGIPFINADEIAETFKNNPEIKAGKKFIAELEKQIQKGKSFAIESTISGKTLVKHLKSAKAKGFRIVMVYLYLNNYDTNIERIKIRVKSGGHDVPTKDVIRRFYRSKNNFWNIYRNLSEDWILIYNPNESLTPVALGNMRNKDFKTINEKLMENFLEQVNEK